MRRQTILSFLIFLLAFFLSLLFAPLARGYLPFFALS